jgi:hypothetical protein
MRVGVVPIQIHDGHEQVTFRGVQLGHMVTRANVVIRVAGEIIPEWIPGSFQTIASAAT